MTTQFVWAGGLLMAQIGSDGNTIAWCYDQNGCMIGFTLNGVPYFYLRNLQGDVVGVHDSNGSVVASYSYDAWGNWLDIHDYSGYNVGGINPIRYRGYYFDIETGYYYCQSRYYNPLWCRWISADVYMDTQDGVLGTNMYTYCQNDPVNRYDPSGFAALNFKEKAFLLVYGWYTDVIVRHWVTGNGKMLIINDDTDWNEKMFSNKIIRQTIDDAVAKALNEGKTSFDYKNTAIALTKNGNGGYFTLFQLLNGANQDYGGFDYSGKITTHKDGSITVKGEFTFNDFMDINTKYKNDVRWYNFLKKYVLSEGNGVDYALKIRCTYSYTYRK